MSQNCKGCLRLIRLDNLGITCTSGEGAMLDDALVITHFVGTVISLQADTTVVWGPHYGLRMRVRTDTAAVS